jgi:hypothetical protein
MIHTLKTVNPHFASVWDGNKKFEIRNNDRNFKPHEFLLLREYNPKTKTYSGKQIKCLITHILSDYEGLSEGYVVMSIQVLIKENIKSNGLRFYTHGKDNKISNEKE